MSGLRRELGLGSAVAAVAGECIAIGIFLTPAGMAKSLGSPFWLLMVWALIAAMAVSGALCFGELTTRFPEDGGLYVYVREGYGRRLAFLYGWMSLLVMDPGITAAMAVGMGSYAAYLFGWPAVSTKAVAIAAIVALGVVNAFNVRISAGLLRMLTWMKFGILGLIVVRGLMSPLGSWHNFVPFVAQRAGSMPLAGALGAGAVAAFYSYGGWWDVSKIAGEVRTPARILPRALLLGVVVVTLIYVLISGVFLYVVPLQSVVSDTGFVSQAGLVLFGGAGARILSGAVVLCVLGSLAVLLMVSPRVYFAMAEDGLFLRSVAVLHPRFGTPARAIAVQVVVASVLILLGTFDQIVSFFIFVAVLFLGIAASTVFRFRRRNPEATCVATPGYPFVPAFFLAMVGVLLGLILAHDPLQALVGVAVVAVGVPVFSWLGRGGQRRLQTTGEGSGSIYE